MPSRTPRPTKKAKGSQAPAGEQGAGHSLPEHLPEHAHWLKNTGGVWVIQYKTHNYGTHYGSLFMRRLDSFCKYPSGTRLRLLAARTCLTVI